MKIAYLANTRFPSERAHSSQIAQMCKAFVGSGAEVDLFVNKRTIMSLEKTSEYLGIDIDFSIINLPPSFFWDKLKIGFYFSEVVFVFSFLFRKNSGYSFMYSRSEWVLWLLSFFVNNKKLVWESHEAKINFAAKSLLLKKKVKTVVISDGIYEAYLMLGVPAERLSVAYDGMDDGFFKSNLESKNESRMRLGIPINEKVVMYIGGFDEWKGVGTFCESSNLLSDVHLFVIGGKNSQVEEMKKKYPSVTFLGELPYKDLKNNQRSADILIVPNSAKIDLSSKYTSPLKLFAHMASGIPMVVSDIPSLISVTGRDMVTLFEPDSSEDLAKAIKRVFKEYEKKGSMANELMEYSRKFTWQKRAKNIVDFISVY